MSTYWDQAPVQLSKASHAFVDETGIGDFYNRRAVSRPPRIGQSLTALTTVRDLLDALINSFFLVFAGEMGDKTQILALILTARYKKPWVVLAGVFVATVLNHALAAWGGGWLAAQVSPQYLKWGLALIFFAFAAWILIPDKESDVESKSRFGPFVTTVIAFFLAEMGDKTQLATIALGARYSDTVMVTLGTTLGMMGSNALAIFLGDKLLKRIPMQKVRIAACVLFVLFGIGILIGF